MSRLSLVFIIEEIPFWILCISLGALVLPKGVVVTFPCFHTESWCYLLIVEFNIKFVCGRWNGWGVGGTCTTTDEC